MRSRLAILGNQIYNKFECWTVFSLPFILFPFCFFATSRQGLFILNSNMHKQPSTHFTFSFSHSACNLCLAVLNYQIHLQAMFHAISVSIYKFIFKNFQNNIVKSHVSNPKRNERTHAHKIIIHMCYSKRSLEIH